MDKSLENRRRVKLYVLNSARHWDDRGTGHVQALYLDRLSGWSLIVREEISNASLLESKIDLETSYQKQQETLIVWSENDSDMALSFQEKTGCEEVWAKICQVQGKDPSVEITQDNFDDDEEDESSHSLTNYNNHSSTSSDSSSSNINNAAGVPLPPCELGKLDKMVEVMQMFMTTPAQRDRLATAIEQEDYVRKLLDVFRKCEDVEHSEGLQQLYFLVKNMLMLNKTALYEVLFSDECIEGVLGCLEYDPNTSSEKKMHKHRQYVKEVAQFKEVIPLENAELYAKIQQLYRVQYIQDVVLPSPSVFEDNVLSTLHSYVFFNKVEIVSMLQEDERFLKELFAQLSDETAPLEKRRDQILFLKEFCHFSQTLQPQQREGFFRMLMCHGILGAVQSVLDILDTRTRAAVVDVFTYIVEMHPFTVREYSMSQAGKEVDDQKLFFVQVIQKAVVGDPDSQAAGAMQILAIMRLLLDPENMLSSPNKTEKTEFLSFFYKRCLPFLVEPIREFTANSPLLPHQEDLRKVLILNLILEFLGYCVEHHTFHIKNYIIGQDLLKQVMVLLHSRHAFLVVAVVRFVRKIVGLADQGMREFYYRCIEKGDHFKPLIDVILKNGKRNNLLNSTILEMFEHIRREDLKKLIIYTMGTHGELLRNLGYTTTFDLLQSRYISHTTLTPEPSNGRERTVTPDLDEDELAAAFQATVPKNSSRLLKRARRDERELDEDEEQWFSEDAEEEKTTAAAAGETTASETNNSSDTTQRLLELHGIGPLQRSPAFYGSMMNAAPPVKRPAADDEDEGIFSRDARNRPARKMLKGFSPSTSQQQQTALKVSLASADSTRHLPSSSNHISSSTVACNEVKNPASPALVDYPDDEEVDSKHEMEEENEKEGIVRKEDEGVLEKPPESPRMEISL